MKPNTMRSLLLLAALVSCIRTTSAAQQPVSYNCLHDQGLVECGPDYLKDTSSILTALQRPGVRRLHIIYVHGIAQSQEGASIPFQQSICSQLHDCDPPVPKDSRYKRLDRDYVDAGKFDSPCPPLLRYFSFPATDGSNNNDGSGAVWKDCDAWRAARPFVDHYEIKRRNNKSIHVDEINWWPLVLPLKCRAILIGEAFLAGPDKTNLDICTKYAWIDKSEAQKLERLPSRAARFNRAIKDGVIDWRFSDAVMAVGPLQDYLQAAMRQLILKSVRYDLGHKNGDLTDEEVIVVSHSLGSYLLFSTLQNEGLSSQVANGNTSDTTLAQATQMSCPDISTLSDTSTSADSKEWIAACNVFSRTSQVYFFANQLSLLEMTNLTNDSSKLAAQMKTWKALRRGFLGEQEFHAKRPQLVAWSDPSDLLTMYVPHIDGAIVANIYVQNATHWFWLIESPTKAHGRYSTNPKVMKTMFRDTSVRE